MILGYSCWGFLGPGIADTPDGGRSHRVTFIRELVARGIEVVMLQRNRDLLEAQDNLSCPGVRFSDGLPQIDALFLEYRWPISGRNTGVSRDHPAYTPDLDRQAELVDAYTARGVPVLVWDKDQKLHCHDARAQQFIVFEAALRPQSGRQRLLFPMDRRRTAEALARLATYSAAARATDLLYIGNQYERDESFAEFIDAPAAHLETSVPVYGNWDKYPKKAEENRRRFPSVRFMGGIPWAAVEHVYRSALATVLIAPARYYHSGQYTQRLFEALWAGCIPLVPACYLGAGDLFFGDLIVSDAHDVVAALRRLRSSDDRTLGGLLSRQLARLHLFAPEAQAEVVVRALETACG